MASLHIVVRFSSEENGCRARTRTWTNGFKVRCAADYTTRHCCFFATTELLYHTFAILYTPWFLKLNRGLFRSVLICPDLLRSVPIGGVCGGTTRYPEELTYRCCFSALAGFSEYLPPCGTAHYYSRTPPILTNQPDFPSAIVHIYSTLTTPS